MRSWKHSSVRSQRLIGIGLALELLCRCLVVDGPEKAAAAAACRLGAELYMSVYVAEVAEVKGSDRTSQQPASWLVIQSRRDALD